MGLWLLWNQLAWLLGIKINSGAGQIPRSSMERNSHDSSMRIFINVVSTIINTE